MVAQPLSRSPFLLPTESRDPAPSPARPLTSAQPPASPKAEAQTVSVHDEMWPKKQLRGSGGLGWAGDRPEVPRRDFLSVHAVNPHTEEIGFSS